MSCLRLLGKGLLVVCSGLLLGAGRMEAQATAPSLALANTAVGSQTTGSVTFTFTAMTTVSAVSVVTQGVTGLDFQSGTQAPATACAVQTYAANATCTVAVNFVPRAAGLRLGAVALYDASNNLLGQANLTGTGLGGLPIIPTTTEVTLAGFSGLSSPFEMTADAAGAFYVGNFSNGALYKYVLSSGNTYTQTTVASGLGNLAQIVVDGAGNVYAISSSLNAVYKETLNPSNGTYTQTTLSLSPTFSNTWGLAFDVSGNLFLSNGETSIYKYPYANGSYGTGTQILSGFGNITSIQVDAANNLYLADANNGNVLKETYANNAGTVTYTQTTVASGLGNSNGLVLDPTGGFYVSTGNGVYHYYIAAGATTYTQTTVFPGGIAATNGVAVTSTGVVFTNGNSNNTLYRVDQSTVPAYTASGSTAVGSTSTSQTTTLLNNGNAQTTNNTTSATAPGADGSGETCTGATIGSNATCTLSIAFAPTTHGASPQSGSVTHFFTPPTGTTAAFSIAQTVTGTVTGDPTKVVITTAPTSGVPAGSSPGQLVAQLDDANSAQAVNDTTAAITLTITNTATTAAYPTGYSYTATMNASGSVATFTVPTLRQSGTYTYTVTSPGLASASTTATVAPGMPSSLTIAPPVTAVYVGQPDSITVTAFDAYSNVATNDTDTNSLTSTDSKATLPANFALANGTATLSVKFGQAGTFTVTAADVTNTAVASATTPMITVSALPSYTVTTGNDDAASPSASNCSNQSNAGATLDSSCSLRDAIAATNGLNFVGTTNVQPTINFAPALSGGTVTLTAALKPTANVNIAGPGAALLTIAPATTSAYSAIAASTGSIALSLSGVTMIHFGTTSFSDVAAIVVTGNSASTPSLLTLTNDTFQSNNADGVVTTTYTTLVINASSFLGNQNTSVVSATSAPSVTITGSTFGSQAAPNLASSSNGGALYLAASPATISTSTFAYNQASSGGAIYAYAGGALTLNNDVFLNNSATNGIGGAVESSTSAMTVMGCTFNNNTSTSNGGAINSSVLITLSGSSFSGNQAGSNNSTAIAGAIYNGYTGAQGSITNSNFIGNKAVTTSGTAEGGAVFLGRVNLTNVLFSGNYTSGTTNAYGGAAYFSGNFTNKLTGVTFTGNATQNPAGSTGATTQYGGALYQTGSSGFVTMYNTTITGNSSKIGGGVYKAQGTLDVYNTVISGNTASGTYPDADTVFYGTSSYYDNVTTNPCSPAASSCTPLLSALGSYGGGTVGAPGYTTPVMTMIPLPSSPLLAAGSSANISPTLAGGATTDARGFPRTVNGNVDIGAAEANYTLAFVQQPGNAEIGGSQISTVQLYESGALFAPGSSAGSLVLSDAAGLLSSGVSTLAASGLEVNNARYSSLATGDTLQASIQGASSTVVASTTSNAFNITSASGATEGSLVLQGFPANTPTGVAQSIRVIALDTAGAVFTGYTGTVTFTSSDALAGLPASYTFTSADAGEHTFTITLNTAGTQSITATDGTFTATQTGIVTTGYVWAVNPAGSLSKLYENGTAISPAGGYTGTGNTTNGLAFDAASDAWSLNASANTLTEFSRTGVALFTSAAAAGGLNAPQQVAIDGMGQVWVTNANGSLSLFSNSGTALSPATGFTGMTSASSGGTPGYAAPTGIAIDISGNVWVANSTANTVTRVLGAAAPVAPLSTSILNGTTGARP